ncbi:hypothetical protein [Benzoatithermus flavus]|uniref:Uncharacterized protein n=1 Tax=Benzoatithermus flavus TaxID=3108223 RepID=A0ABU8XX26_9PROT
MATKLVPSIKDASPGELVRLVEDQHRRLRLVRSQLVEEVPVDAIVETFPARCAKPHLGRAALARLLEEAQRRRELDESALGAAIRAAWPERRPDIPVLRPSPGLGAYALRSVAGVPNIVFALFGKDRGEAEAAVDRVVTEQRTGEPFIPIFLINDNDFTVFRDQKLAFEYFPFVCDDRAGPPEPRWAAYFLDTLALTLRRWGVCRIVSL